jgi:hypothetical protein
MTVYLGAAPAQPPFAMPTIADALSRLRQDIFDAAGPSPRWQDTDLTRAIDRAIDRYSFISPFIQTALIPAVGGSRLYALPASAAVFGPSWWLEAVEYPTGFYPRRYVPYQEIPQPGLGVPSAPVATGPSGGPIAGAYRYRVTFVGIAGETLPSPPSNSVNGIGFGVALALPLGPAPYTRARNLYRTPANGADGTQLLVATIADNTSTTYVDQATDGALGAPMPQADSTAGAAIVELRITDMQLPDPTNPGTLQAMYGCKHVWATNGTSLPEQHHDIVLLGAAAYACLAYTVPTNDLFEYQDGELRDKVSETKTPEHWQAMGKLLLATFESRLEEVKRQRDAQYADVAQWGSVSARWQWT